MLVKLTEGENGIVIVKFDNKKQLMPGSEQIAELIKQVQNRLAFLNFVNKSSDDSYRFIQLEL